MQPTERDGMARWARNNRMTGGLLAACVVTMAAGLSQSPTLTADERLAAATITVPLAIELYDGVPLPEGGLSAVIGRVNAIYAPAGVRFRVVDTRRDLAAPAHDGWTLTHRIALSHERRSHLDHLIGRLRGVSVSFTAKPNATSPATNGLAYGSSGVVILRPHPDGLDKTAQTLAHELTHTLGLTDLYDDADRGRLRYGYARLRTGVTLTGDDAARIRTLAAARAGLVPLSDAEALTLASTAASSAPAAEADQSEIAAAR